jgi:hypothetical protein
MRAILVALLGVICQAHLIQGVIDRKGNVLDFSKVQITLNGGEYNSLVDSAGKFSIVVPNHPALYKLEVQNLHYYFEPVVVDVLE